MARCIILGVFALCSLRAGVVVTKMDGHMWVAGAKAYLYPLGCGSGKIVTRSFPPEEFIGEP